MVDARSPISPPHSIFDVDQHFEMRSLIRSCADRVSVSPVVREQSTTALTLADYRGDP
jgi:hypothetical protein